MRDTEVFSTLLGLNASWQVSSVDLRLADCEIVLGLEHVGVLVCPVCGEACSQYDCSEERRWRHLDTMQFATIVVACIPRVRCAKDGVKQVDVPWAGAKSRFTQMFEQWVIAVLELTKSQSRTAKLLKLSPNQVHDIMHRAVDRGLARRKLGKVEHVSVDEKSFQKGHRYGTVVCDAKHKRVIEVAQGRDEEAAKNAFAALPYPEAVKTVSMDMSEAFRNAVQDSFPEADLIHDRFHVAMMLGKAVDEVRRSEIKRRPELKESRYVWLKNEENLTPAQRWTLESLMGIELKTAEAYAFRQVFRCFFDQESATQATRFFNDWLGELEKSDLSPMRKVAKTLQKNFQGLLNYVKWRLTNGYAEAVNGLIQELKTVARGFRRFENFRIAILFFLGGLDLNPRKCP